MTWEDERYMDVNQERATNCPSNYVLWTQKNQFWLPSLSVLDYLKLVKSLIRAVQGSRVD